MMSVLADKIEQFILHKLLEEDNSDIVLRRNELADELQCAPSQISYVLSTRFSNDKGYLVESRRGSGGSVPTIKLTPQKKDRTPAIVACSHDLTYEGRDARVDQLLGRRSLTNDEGVIIHLTFESLYRRIDDEGTRLLVISDILKNLNLH
mgnify:CR=1 FL=1